MSIPRFNRFHYEGYVLVGTKPTLYFKEGRYTQEHFNPSKIGWHPIKTKHCHRTNITPAALRCIMEQPAGDPKESLFAMEIIAGLHNDNSDNGMFCECLFDNYITFSIRVSLGRLVRVGDADFDAKYDEIYAKRVLAIGVYASSEQ